MAESQFSKASLANLPPVSAKVHNGHCFNSDVFRLLDSFHLPVAIMDAWDGNWLNIVYMNKRHAEVLGSADPATYMAKINQKGAKVTKTFEKRLQMWKEIVQVHLNFHDDPHKLFPDSGAPIAHFTRMLPINLEINGTRGIYTMAVHIPENTQLGNEEKRAADAFVSRNLHNSKGFRS